MSATQPKWQKARVLAAESVPAAIGRTIWVYNQPPRPVLTTLIDASGADVPNSRHVAGPSFVMHVTDNDGGRMSVAADTIELLPDFADDVALVPLAEFLKAEVMQ